MERIPAEVDVLIVGLGPAGLAAANVLVKASRSVLVLDARRQLGGPLRSGGLTRAGLFRELGMPGRTGWVRTALTRPKGAAVVHWNRLERDLVRHLKRRGAQVELGVAVMGIGAYGRGQRPVQLSRGEQRREVLARLVIAADGVASGVARAAGLDTRLKPVDAVSCVGRRLLGAALRAPGRAVVHPLPARANGWSWTVPFGDDGVSVGLAVPSAMGRAAEGLLEQVLAISGAARGGRVAESYAGISPACFPLARPFADGLLVVGAAARLVNANTGEGLWPAAHSGRLAGETFLKVGRETTAQRLGAYRRRLEPLYLDLYRSVLQRHERERRTGRR